MAEEFATKERDTAFQSLSELKRRWKEGTFGEIVDDWKWIFTYSVRYKKAIAFYIVLGIISTSLGLVSSVIGKYLIDIVTGYQTDKLWVLIVMGVGSSLLRPPDPEFLPFPITNTIWDEIGYQRSLDMVRQ